MLTSGPLPNITGQTQRAASQNKGGILFPPTYFEDTLNDLDCVFKRMCALEPNQYTKTAATEAETPSHIVFDVDSPTTANSAATVYQIKWNEIFAPELSHVPKVIGLNFDQTEMVIINVFGAPEIADFNLDFVGDFILPQYIDSTVWNFCDLSVSIRSGVKTYGAWFVDGANCSFEQPRSGGTYNCSNFDFHATAAMVKLFNPVWCPTNLASVLDCREVGCYGSI